MTRERLLLVAVLVSDRESEISVENIELTLLDAELSLSLRVVLATIRTAFEDNAATFA